MMDELESSLHYYTMHQSAVTVQQKKRMKVAVLSWQPKVGTPAVTDVRVLTKKAGARMRE